MSYSAAEIHELLTEMPIQIPTRNFDVDYYVMTPKGSRTRFRRTTGISQILDARSETAVYFYLKRLHPNCDVQIQSLEWK